MMPFGGCDKSTYYLVAVAGSYALNLTILETLTYMETASNSLDYVQPSATMNGFE